MAYACPRCGKPIQRGENKIVGLVAGGLVGALLAFAFGSFQCSGCGKIPMKEFPPEVRKKSPTGISGAGRRRATAVRSRNSSSCVSGKMTAPALNHREWEN